jgi:hypothetical protein
VVGTFDHPARELACRFFSIHGSEEDALAAARRTFVAYATERTRAAVGFRRSHPWFLRRAARAPPQRDDPNAEARFVSSSLTPTGRRRRRGCVR